MAAIAQGAPVAASRGVAIHPTAQIDPGAEEVEGGMGTKRRH